MNKIRTYYSFAFLYLFKWLYRHCRLFRNRIRKLAKKQGDVYLILIELFVSDGNINFIHSKNDNK